MTSESRNKKSNSKPRKKAKTDPQTDSPDTIQSWLTKSTELLFVLLLFGSLFLTISVISFSFEESPGSDTIGRKSGWLGQAGAAVAWSMSVITFGRFGVLSIPLSVFLVLYWWISKNRFNLTRWLTGLLSLGFFIGFLTAFIRPWIGLEQDDVISGLGPIWLAQLSTHYLHRPGTIIVSIAILTAIAVISFDLKMTTVVRVIVIQIPKALFKVYRSIAAMVLKNPDMPVDKGTLSKDNVDSEISSELNNIASEIELPSEPDLADSIEILPKEEPELNQQESMVSVDPVDAALSSSDGKRQLPTISLLNPPMSDLPEIDKIELEENARRLEDKLASMRINAKVLKTNPGPIITRYDIEPPPEVKIARIVALSDDIAMTLRARGVRILAPIPGEAAVGVEIPNRHSQTVLIYDVINSAEFQNSLGPLTIALGKDTQGKIFCFDLTRAPHLLIAGSTGSGKSVCINILLASLLFRCDPRDVRVILVDPKKIELSLYSRLSEQHLVNIPGISDGVITSPEDAVKALQSVHAEMERRYDMLAESGHRSIAEYNSWIDSTSPEEEGETDARERLPYLVVIIDELADLMMSVRREFEELLVRLAQMARAVGIHLVVATQRPSVDVVTGLIKANFPVRIAFKVAQKVDSRTIIDAIGAEKLLGKGDMLLQGLGGFKVQRLHGALIETEEVERIVEFVRAQPTYETGFKMPNPEVVKLNLTSDGSDVDRDGVDELFDEAAKIIVKTEQGSVSVLQRRLRVGYARAARLIDQLEQAGVVGPFDGSKARQVLLNSDDLRERWGIEID